MDSVTHIFLGGALAQAVAGRRVGHVRAFLLGALAATVPDFDVFFHTGDALLNHAMHRHFMHALIMVPVLAAVALALSCGYLGVAGWQHARAQAAQAELLAARQEKMAENPRVLPQVGAVVSYRSIYIAGGQIHVDAIRVPFFGVTSFKPGGSVPVVAEADLHNAVSIVGRQFAMFADMADGFVARSPTDPLLLSD